MSNTGWPNGFETEAERKANKAHAKAAKKLFQSIPERQFCPKCGKQFLCIDCGKKKNTTLEADG